MSYKNGSMMPIGEYSFRLFTSLYILEFGDSHRLLWIIGFDFHGTTVRTVSNLPRAFSLGQ
jgi:hypothetical protein